MPDKTEKMNRRKNLNMDIGNMSIKILLDASLDAAFLMNENIEFVAFNRAGLEKLRGRNPKFKKRPVEFFIGKSVVDFYPDEFLQVCYKFKKIMMKTGKPKRFQFKLGNRVLDLTGYPVINKDDASYNFAVYSHDTTRELKAENRIKKSEERFRDLVDQMYEGYVVIDKNGVIIFINKAIEIVGGYNQSDLIGKHIKQIFPHQEREKIQHVFNKLKNLENVRFQTTILTKNNQLRTILCSNSPITDQDGNFDGFQGSITDITALRNARESLEYHIEFQKKIIEISTSFINIQESEIDKAIYNALDIMGSFNKEERILLYTVDTKDNLLQRLMDWNIKGGKRAETYPATIDINAQPYFTGFFKKLYVIHVPDVSELPPEARKETAFPEKIGVKAFLLVPIIFNNTLIGLCGITSTKQKSWSEDQIALIKMALGGITLIVERRRISTDLIGEILNRLSDREKEFICYLAHGYRWPKDKRLIGKKMDVLPGTLDKFLTRIKSKMRNGEFDMIINNLKNNKSAMQIPDSFTKISQ